MKIKITSAVGSGPTPLAAFDSALRKAGIGNYNLIPLSSVIPPGAELERTPIAALPSEYGHRLYLVMARFETTQIGEEACAGLGWTQDADTGRGLFVELEGTNRCSVENAIESTLNSMKLARHNQYGKNERELVSVICEREPVCALVVAVYESEGWDT